MDLFTYLLGKKGQNTQRDLFSYLLGKGAGGSGTYVNFSGTSLNISNTLRARIKNITLKGATSQDGTPTPDTPIPIKVVTGEQNVNVSSPNLFDYKNQNYSSTRATYLLENNGLKITSSGTYAMITSDFDVEIGKTYTMSFNTVNNDNVGAGIQIRSSSALLITGGGPTGYTSLTFTATENKVYFRFYSNTSGTPRTNIVEYQNIQIEEGDVATPYVPYYNKDYPLSLGNIELAEITENYQDYIYGTPNNWYKYKFVQKSIFNGSENWSLSSLGDGKFYVQLLPRFKVKTNPLGYKPYLSHFIGKDNTDTFENGKGLLYYTVSTDFLRVEYDNTPTLAEWKTWLNDNNLTIYYLLNEPVSEQITDTTLIGQLNNLYNAISAQGTTYITCSSASDSNEIIVFSGDIKVASVGLGNSLNTSLLSSNIQEETNVDDVNEIEDIEQNEESIEEEVS